jgi:hypothetical protein
MHNHHMRELVCDSCGRELVCDSCGNDKHPAEVLAEKYHNDQYSKEPGMVYQVWEDGEITLQKSGELLWQRSLHCIVPALTKYYAGLKFPCEYGEHSFAFVRNKEEAEEIRALIAWNPES